MRIRSLSVFASLYEEEPAEAGHEVTGLALCPAAKGDEDATAEREPLSENAEAESFLPAA